MRQYRSDAAPPARSILMRAPSDSSPPDFIGSILMNALRSDTQAENRNKSDSQPPSEITPDRRAEVRPRARLAAGPPATLRAVRVRRSCEPIGTLKAAPSCGSDASRSPNLRLRPSLDTR